MTHIPGDGGAAARLALGRVVGAHGIRGEVRVLLYDGSSRNVRPGLDVLLIETSGRASSARVAEVARVGPRTLRIRFHGMDTRDTAQELRGCELAVTRTLLAPLAEDELYVADLMGARVERKHCSGEVQGLGEIVALTSNGVQDLLEVRWRDAGGHTQTWLLPLLPQFIRTFDAGVICVELPEGMLPEALEHA